MRVTAEVANPGAAQRVLVGKIELATRVKMANTGREMVRLANAKMAANFDLGRPGTRRRYPGTTRAANALDYQLDGTSFPMTVRFRVKGGDDVLKRIIFMNSGTSPHTIRPSGAWSGRGSNPIPIPVHALRPGQRRLGWFEDGYWTVVDEVDHPGQRGLHFLEEAMREASDKFMV